MRLVVIGGIAAGLSAAARARRMDPALEIVVLEKGPLVSFGACGLPYYVEGRVSRIEDLVVYTPEYFRKERNIVVRTGTRVVAIQHPRREVLLESGERVHYDRLVMATGARPVVLPGPEDPRVFTMYTAEDARRLRAFLAEQRPRRALVVGAGYIGLEAADALRRHGLAVRIFERGPYVMQREDAGLAARVRQHLQNYGVELALNTRVDAIEDCDLAVLALGVQPNVELAQEAGLVLGRTGALRVDERMETAVRGVFAAGDCAETTHVVTGRPVYVPLGTTANKMGRVAGANAAGARARFPGVAGTSIVRLFDTGFAVTGLSAEHARREGFSPVAAAVESRSRAGYFQGKPVTVELVADRDSRRLLGGLVTGEEDVAGRVNVIAAAITAGMRLDDFEHLDLAYAPPFAPVWDPLLIAAQQLMRQL